MEKLQNNITLQLCPGAFPLSTDSMALADFARLPARASVLDLGSGCGTLGLMLCAKDAGCTVTGVELDPDAHGMALHNSKENHLDARLNSICADIRSIPQLLCAGSFDCCVSNPPYFSGGPASKACPTARREDCCDLPALFRSAAWALRYGGDFYLVHRPERLAEVIAAGAQVHLEAKRLRLLRHRENQGVSLVLLQLRKGGRPGLIWEECCLHDSNGNQTEDYRRIYHL